MRKLLTSFEEQSDRVDYQLASFTVHINITERSILERSDEIKQTVDMHTQALIAELESHKTYVLKNIRNTKEELGRNVMMCENFVSYCRKAIEEADAVESIRIAEELRTRAGELKEKPSTKINQIPDIRFHQSDLDVATNLRNVVGNIQGEYWVYTDLGHTLVLL